MPPNRPTFSESWYRVADLRPQLRTTVQTFRQHYRGRQWQVVRDPANNQFFRLNDASYFFIGLLNGQRSVADAWRIANDQLGDRAPTQNEVIQLLGQLYGANLLIAELPADSAGLFERYKKKIRREVTSYVTNILFARVPLWDPDHFLDRWVRACGWVFNPVGVTIWAALMLFAGFMLVGRVGDLWTQRSIVLDPNNLIYMYTAMVFTKALHELGHGFACKRYGRQSHSGGEVHTIGIMFLVFIPVPYVDASSAWALRSKWQRAMIGAAGMYVELAVAAIAVIVWTQTASDNPINKIAYNTIFIASVSTILFNGNPLLRFDGYYILSDALEIPNLSQRGKDFVYYLVKRYIYGAKQARHPMLGPGERPWLILFFIASTIYRTIISLSILMFVWFTVPFIGMVMAVVSMVMWICVPTGKFVHYLLTHDELMRTRPRAIASTVAFISAVVILLGVIPFTEHARAEGVVEPGDLKMIYAIVDGRVREVMPTDSPVTPDAAPMMAMVNEQLEAQLQEQMAKWRVVDTQHARALGKEPELANALLGQRRAVEKRIDVLRDQLAALQIKAPIAGRWVTDKAENLDDVFVQRGQRVGMVADVEHLIVRIAANQRLGPRLIEDQQAERSARVELRVPGRPDLTFTGVVEQIYESGQHDLPSAALGYFGGGELEVSTDDPQGAKTVKAFFEVIITPHDIVVVDEPRNIEMPLRSGQRIVARFDLPRSPLIAQWWRLLLQTIRTRFAT